MASPVLISNGPAGKGGRILIIGATGFIGQFISQGAIKDQEFMEELLSKHEIDIVISAVGGENILDQLVLVQAIKAVGTTKRFLPSEFGHEVDRSDPVEPGLNMYKEKRRVRRVIKEMNIPYTYNCCSSVASWHYYDNKHPSEVLPPLDHFQIYGDGTVKAYFVAGADIGKFTIKAAEDYRTVDKCVHFRPKCNFLNMKELSSLWEDLVGDISCSVLKPWSFRHIPRFTGSSVEGPVLPPPGIVWRKPGTWVSLPRVTITGDAPLAVAAEKIIPRSVVASLTHEIFIRGWQIEFSIDGIKDLEVCDLYPNESFLTMDECFNDFLLRMNEMLKMSTN